MSPAVNRCQPEGICPLSTLSAPAKSPCASSLSASAAVQSECCRSRPRRDDAFCRKASMRWRRTGSVTTLEMGIP